MVTIYRNIAEIDTPYHIGIATVLGRIKEGKSQDLIKKIRNEKDKEKRNLLKKGLPSICFSGEFTKRTDNNIKSHSGFICLDFDDYETRKDMLAAKDRLTKDPYSYAVFISPSDLGLKVIVKIPKDIDNHKQYFHSLELHYNDKHFDTTSKNISRVCYESFDPQIYINSNSSVWDKIEEKEYEPLNTNRTATIAITDENKIVDILIKWWTKNYPMISGQRNNNIYVISAAMNEFGVNQSLAKYILGGYAGEGFSVTEIHASVDSAYKRTENFRTKFYEDEVAVAEVKEKLKRGVTKKEIRSQLDDSNIDSDVAALLITRLDEEVKRNHFWEKSNKGIVKMIHIMFKKFLEDNGFYKYCPEGSKSFVFVRIQNNLIDHTNEQQIKDFVLNHLLELDDTTIYNYFANEVRFFRENFLTLLATIDVPLIKDDKDTAYLYYRNCAVKITKNKITLIDYLDLGGYVWKDHIIDRVFKECVPICDFKQFISNVCNKDADRIRSMESTIGFMLHGFKNPSFCPAVILYDEVISDNPEGGTGKGLFMEGLNQMKKMVKIDGKHFDFTKSFPYQLVSADTQIIVFDDVTKNFKFERLFSVITEGLTLEKKNQDAIKIGFDVSPKIGITTNYAIKGTGNSFARRKWELEMHPHYTMNYSPLDEFKKMMFTDWDDEEYCCFDNFMLLCLQGYLSTGLIKSSFVNSKIRDLIINTSHEFVEWCGEISGEKNHLLLSCI